MSLLSQLSAPARQVSRRTHTAYERFRLGSRPLVLVSNNCWGYELYNALGREYATPFVGLFVYPECYLSLLRTKFPDRLTLAGFAEHSRYSASPLGYPVGLLEDGEELHFLHYGSPAEAEAKWVRRVARMREALEQRATVLAVKMCDRDGCTPEHLRAFHELPLPVKLTLGVTSHPSRDHLSVPSLMEPGTRNVVDGRTLYRKRYRYFDVAEWLLTGTVGHTRASRALRVMAR